CARRRDRGADSDAGGASQPVHRRPDQGRREGVPHGTEPRPAAGRHLHGRHATPSAAQLDRAARYAGPVQSGPLPRRADVDGDVPKSGSCVRGGGISHPRPQPFWHRPGAIGRVSRTAVRAKYARSAPSHRDGTLMLARSLIVVALAALILAVCAWTPAASAPQPEPRFTLAEQVII